MYIYQYMYICMCMYMYRYMMLFQHINTCGNGFGALGEGNSQ